MKCAGVLRTGYPAKPLKECTPDPQPRLALPVDNVVEGTCTCGINRRTGGGMGEEVVGGITRNAEYPLSH